VEGLTPFYAASRMPCNNPRMARVGRQTRDKLQILSTTNPHFHNDLCCVSCTMDVDDMFCHRFRSY